MKIRCTIFNLFLSIYGFGQPHIFDTTHNAQQLASNNYYSKTDFANIDSLALWNYFLDTTYRGKDTDSVKPVGLLTFWRNQTIDDGISKKLYGRLWRPCLEFEIYRQPDSSYCYKRSLQTRIFSSCVPPNVGGDIISISPYIFLSRWVCLNCQRYDTKVDYCRPVINFVFSSINRSKVTSLQSLVKQFPIAEGRLPKED